MRLLMCIFLLFSTACAAVEVDLNAIVAIESSGRPDAYNKKSGARGLMQITPVVLKEFNARWKTDHRIEDLFNPALNRAVGSWYIRVRIPEMLRAYGLPVTIENILAAYNCGAGKLRKGVLPEETRSYLRKYERLTGGL